jgi:hypothetical protein
MRGWTLSRSGSERSLWSWTQAAADASQVRFQAAEQLLTAKFRTQMIPFGSPEYNTSEYSRDQIHVLVHGLSLLLYWTTGILNRNFAEHTVPA